MKKVSILLITGIAAIAFGMPAPVMAADQDLLQKIEQLSRELETLKQQVKKGEEKSQEIDALKLQVKKNEEKSLSHWLSVSGDYRFRVDNLHGRTAPYADGLTLFNGGSMASAKRDAVEVKNDALYTNRFGLNLKAKATQDVTVTTRFLMYKTFGAQEDNSVRSGDTAYSLDRAGTFDGTVGHVPNDNKLLVDRVYATWNNIAEQPVWLSIGRRPSTGGVPTHLKHNDEPPGNSGVPALLVDYAFDGMTLGYAPDITMLPGAYMKFCYGRGFQDNLENADTGNGLQNTDMIGLNIVPYETDRFRAEFQYNRGMNIFDAPKMLSGPFPLTTKTNLGDIDWYGIDFLGMVKNVGTGNVHWFVNGAVSKTHPNGNTLKFNGMDTGDGLLYSGIPQDKTGWALYVGGRYDFTSTGTKIGLEYNHGSEDWITFAPAADDMWTSKLGVRGDVYEVYLIQELKLKPISSYLSKTFFRIGYQYYEFAYTGSNNWLGSPIKISEMNNTRSQLTAPLKSAQDIYGTFEVHF